MGVTLDEYFELMNAIVDRPTHYGGSPDKVHGILITLALVVIATVSNKRLPMCWIAVTHLLYLTAQSTEPVRIPDLFDRREFLAIETPIEKYLSRDLQDPYSKPSHKLLITNGDVFVRLLQLWVDQHKQ